MIYIWLGFIALLLLLLALDLGVFNRRPHVIGTAEALGWTGLWVAVALIFNVVVYFGYAHHWLGLGETVGHPLSGSNAALEYFTGYVIEKSLSLDNIFVIALLFTFFRVPAEYQHRVLFWGILGALVFRGAMILAGAALIARFEWIIFVFGGLLLLTALKMLVSRDEEMDVAKNPIVRLARRWLPVTGEYHGGHFFVRRDGRLMMTPLCLVIIVIESTDVLFAVDSIPAIFAVTRDPFIIFSSNALAILGLRSLYFALAGAMRKFRYLKLSLVFVLAFVGAKMLFSHVAPIPTAASLAIILGILMVGITASVASVAESEAREPSAMAKFMNTANGALRHAWRIIIFVVGVTVVLFGIVLFFTPGPAIVVIPIGLAILATEFVWARRLMKHFKDTVDKWTGFDKGRVKSKPQSGGAESPSSPPPGDLVEQQRDA